MTSQEELRNELDAILIHFQYGDDDFSEHETRMGALNAILALIKKSQEKSNVEARLDEWAGINTSRHYGLDYQDSLDELDEQKIKRMAELEAQSKETG